jgi:hypothetical protein
MLVHNTSVHFSNVNGIFIWEVGENFSLFHNIAFQQGKYLKKLIYSNINFAATKRREASLRKIYDYCSGRKDNPLKPPILN